MSATTPTDKETAIQAAVQAHADTIPLQLRCEYDMCRFEHLTSHFCAGCHKMVHEHCNISESAEGLLLLAKHPAAADSIEGSKFTCSIKCLCTILVVQVPVDLGGNATTTTTTSSEASRSILDKYKCVMVETHIDNIEIPTHTARDINNDHVATMKDQLKSVGYRPHGGTLAITFRPMSYPGPVPTGSGRKTYERHECEFVLIDGRHRYTALRELIRDPETSQEWETQARKLEVTLWLSKNQRPLNYLEILRLGTHLNDISGLVLASSVRDYVFAAVSAARTITSPLPDEPNPEPSYEPRRIATVFNQEKSIGNHKWRQCRRYANIACRLAPSEQTFQAVLRAFDMSEGKLGVVHLDSPELLRQTDDLCFEFTICTLARRLRSSGEGRFEQYSRLFFSACTAVYNELEKIAQLNNKDMQSLLQIQVPFGRSESTTLRDFASNKLAKGVYKAQSDTKSSKGRVSAIVAKVKAAGYTTEPPIEVSSDSSQEEPDNTRNKKKGRTTKTTTTTSTASTTRRSSRAPTPTDDIPDRPQTPTRPSTNTGGATSSRPFTRAELQRTAALGKGAPLPDVPIETDPDVVAQGDPVEEVDEITPVNPERSPHTFPRNQSRRTKLVPPSRKRVGNLKRPKRNTQRDNRGNRSGDVITVSDNSTSGTSSSGSRQQTAAHLEDDNPLPTDLIPAGNARFDDFVPPVLPFGYNNPPPLPSDGSATDERVDFILDLTPRVMLRYPHLWQPFFRTLLEHCCIPSEHRANVVATTLDFRRMFTNISLKASKAGMLQIPHASRPGPHRDTWFAPTQNGFHYDLYVGVLQQDFPQISRFWSSREQEVKLQGYTLLEGFLNDSKVPDKITFYDENVTKYADWDGIRVEQNITDEDETPYYTVEFDHGSINFQREYTKLYEHWKSSFPSDNVLKDPERNSDTTLPYQYIVNTSSAAQDSSESMRANGRYMSSRRSLMEDLETEDKVGLCRIRALLDLYIGLGARLMNIVTNYTGSPDAMTFIPNTGGRVLVTKGKCKRQLLHADGHPSSVHQVLNGNDNGGFFAIATFAEESPLWVASASHRTVAVAWCMESSAALKALSDSTVVEKVIIPPWSIFYARLDTYHAGPAWSDYEVYSGMSLRYHVYGLPQGFKLKDGVETISEFQPSFREKDWYNEDQAIRNDSPDQSEQNTLTDSNNDDYSPPHTD